MKLREIHVRAALFAASLAALLFGYRVMLTDHAPSAFSGTLEDLSYGWYVPLFSLYILWRERREFLASVGKPGWGGILLALPFFAAGFLGVRGTQLRLEIVGFAGLLVALTWIHFGRAAARRVLFPAAFLLFCMPLATYLDVVTVHLRLFATSVAFHVVRGLGVAVERVGTCVYIPTSSGPYALDVADPCSGLRSLFAMAALTAGYGYCFLPTWTRRAALFACAIPLAIAGNVIRIAAISLGAAWVSPAFASGPVHDYSGYIVFLSAVALMLGASELIARAGRGRAK